MLSQVFYDEDIIGVCIAANTIVHWILYFAN